jgi:glycosyltransferase involved in cell wall biosynthesis
MQAVCHLPGIVTGEQKNKLVLEADIFALPSYNEGLPIALLEAMAAGMAIITTPVGGIPEVITDGDNGFLVAPGNISDLAEKLTILVNNQELRQKMGWRNRKIAEQGLDVKPYAARLVSLYETVTYR